MKQVQVVLNEQHTLLPDQERILNERFGNTWVIYPVPAEGWTLDEQKEKVTELSQAKSVVFASPVPVLMSQLAFYAGYEDARGVYTWPRIMVFHNDRREKKELPDGKVVSVVAKEGWVLV